MTLNGVESNTRKKQTYYFSQCSYNLKRIRIFSLKNLIENNDITPDCLIIKRSKLWKRRKPTRINRKLIWWQVNKFCGKKNYGLWIMNYLLSDNGSVASRRIKAEKK